MTIGVNEYKEFVEKLAEESISKADSAAEEGERELTEEELALLQEEMAQKAAFVYENAINKIATAEELYAEGFGTKGECLEVLASNGLLDVDGFNKEAAEADEEMERLAYEVAEVHDDAITKMAAAQEIYDESIVEANAALEVLSDLGY